jgi:hypothetical protein
MAAKIASVALVAAACLLCIAGATAQPKPSFDGNNGTFAGFNATQFK